MAIVNKATLKGYFEQGDIPTQGQYFNLIESTFNLADTEAQVLQGTISASVGDFEYLKLKKAFIPGIGVGSAKVGTSFTIGDSLELSGSLNITDGNISASGTFPNGTGSFMNLNVADFGTITASGNIKSTSTSSAAEFALDRTDLLGNYPIDVIKYDDAAGTQTAGDAGPVNYEIIGVNIVLDSSGDIDFDAAGDDIKFSKAGETRLTVNTLRGDITASGGITSSGAISTDGNLSSSAEVTCEHLFSSDDAEITDALTVGGNINANGNIVGDGSTAISSMASLGIDSVTATGTIQAEQLTSTDDITATGTVTAEQLTSTDDINATDRITAGGDIRTTGGNFLGNNIGPYQSTHILMMPSDFGVGDLTGKDGVMAGTSIKQSSLGISLYASYVIPQGMQTRTLRIYGDDITVTIIESSIENDTESTLVSDITPGGTTSCVSSAGDGLKYVTVKLSFTDGGDEFHGGKLGIAVV